jgi:menaquinone-dependent protoporphyrinogen oxidase
LITSRLAGLDRIALGSPERVDVPLDRRQERVGVYDGFPASTLGAATDASGVRSDDAVGMKVLVVYASRHGTTAAIAARIADRLVEAGAIVELQSVDQVKALDDFDAVVFGAPVYDQSWPPEANGFVSGQREALAARPLWLFSVGSFGDTKRVIGRATHKEPKDIAQIRAELRPLEYRVFKGVIRKHQWPFWSRVFFRALGGRFDDHPDWPTIDAWAEQITIESFPVR